MHCKCRIDRTHFVVCGLCIILTWAKNQIKGPRRNRSEVTAVWICLTPAVVMTRSFSTIIVLKQLIPDVVVRARHQTQHWNATKPKLIATFQEYTIRGSSFLCRTSAPWKIQDWELENPRHAVASTKLWSSTHVTVGTVMLILVNGKNNANSTMERYGFTPEVEEALQQKNGTRKRMKTHPINSPNGMVIHLETHTAAAANPTAGLCSQSVNTAGAQFVTMLLITWPAILTGTCRNHIKEKNAIAGFPNKSRLFRKFCRGNLGEKFPI